MTRLRLLRQCVQKLVAGAPKRVQLLSFDIMLGLFLGGSVVVCEIARQVTQHAHGLSKKVFRRRLQRLDRGLDRGPSQLLAIWGRYMRMVAPLLRRNYDVIAVDMSEIVKRYGKAMDHLCTVRDGSASTENESVLLPGWWTVEVVATSLKHHVIPLLRRVWSSNHPDFKSENWEVIEAIRTILPFVPKTCLFVFDRGFDGADTLWRGFSELGINWVVRLKRNRSVRFPGSSRQLNVVDAANSIVKDSRTTAWVSRNNKLERVGVCFGWATVQLRQGGEHFTLLTTQFEEGGGAQIMLLTPSRVTNATRAARFVRAYFRRWQVEENIRFDKQTWDLENVRTLRYHKLQTLVMYTVLTAGLLALYVAEHARSALALARQAPIVDDVPPFPMYRVLAAVRAILAGGGQRAFSF